MTQLTELEAEYARLDRLLPGIATKRAFWRNARESARVVGDVIEITDGNWQWSLTIHPTLRLISRVDCRRKSTQTIQYKCIHRTLE